MTLGQLLRQKRNDLRLTLDEVSEAAGCSKSHLHAVENDRSEPGIKLCVRLSVALGLSLQLMGAATLLSQEDKL